MKVTVSIKGLDKVKRPIKEIKTAVLIANTKLYNDCVEGTPVDTGFARASWWPQVDKQPATNPNSPSKDAPVFVPADASALLKGVGALFSVVNSAAYIRRLECDGHSAQNVAWVRRAAAAYPNNLRAALRQVKGKL